MKKLLTTILTAAAMLFISCGNDKPLTIEEIPASGAQSYITSIDSLEDFFDNSEDELEYDYWIQRFSSQEAMQTITRIALALNSNTTGIKFQNEINEFKESIATKGHGTFTYKNNIDPEILKPLKDFGITVTGKQNPVVYTVNKSTDGTYYDVTANFSKNYASVVFDASLPKGKRSVLKGSKLKGSFNGFISAKIKAETLNLLLNDTLVYDVLESLYDFKIKYNFNLGFGLGFCNSNKEGGKFFVTVSSDADTILQPDYFENFDKTKEAVNKLMEEEPYNPDDINSIPANINISIGFYDDKNLPTFTLINANTFEGLFKDILEFSKHMPD